MLFLSFLMFFPGSGNYSKVIIVLKLNEPKNFISSYQSISLLPILEKIFKKLLLKRLTLLIQKYSVFTSF